MTVYVDRRTGSKDLVALLPRGCAELTDLEFADAVVVGRGPDGPVTEAFERKRLADVLTCIQSGRFAGHQLRGMRDDYDFVWLVIEDEVREDPHTGVLQRRYEERVQRKRGRGSRVEGRWVDAMFGAKRTMMYRDYLHWLLSMRRKGGIDDWTHTRNAQETANLIWMVSTWRAKRWSQHKSVDVFNTSQSAKRSPMLAKAPFVAQIAKEYDGVGWDRALAIADTFASVEDFLHADVCTLKGIDGIGDKLAESVVRQTKERRRIVK